MTQTVWIDVVPRGFATQGLSGMLFQTKPIANQGSLGSAGGPEVFLIEMTSQQSQGLALDCLTRGGPGQSQYAAVEVLKAAGIKVHRCSFFVGAEDVALAEIEFGGESGVSTVVLSPECVIDFIIALQAPFRASQEFIDFARRSRLSSGNFSVLVSERVRSGNSRSVRWK